ncbi:hypothetical protein KUCAC02_009607 [Chaenocephalus aceratus]|nr:hypothetical protein KUCAC02_009607 [Chaenocephalus aceratus]
MSWRKTVLSWVRAGRRTTSPDIEQPQGPTSLQSEFQSVSEETEAIRESNRVLSSQIEQVNVETAQDEDLVNRLKSERDQQRGLTEVNERLQCVLRDLGKRKTKDPAILREKLQAAQEEKQNLEQRNDIMRQEILLLGQKSQHDDDMERQLEIVKVEMKSMIVKNKALSVKVQQLLKKVTRRDSLRSKMNTQREKNSIWTQRNIALEREATEITGAISEDRRMREESYAIRAERNAQKKENRVLKKTIVYLRAQSQRQKPFHDIYNALKAAVDAQAEEKENLMRDIDFFHKEIERKDKRHGDVLRIEREKRKMSFENSLLRVDFEALFVKLTANETRTRDSDFLTTGKDTASLLRDDVALKLREMQAIRERMGAMEEESDALLLAHAQELCKERPKIGPWTIQINRGAGMGQRRWAYEVC